MALTNFVFSGSAEVPSDLLKEGDGLTTIARGPVIQRICLNLASQRYNYSTDSSKFGFSGSAEVPSDLLKEGDGLTTTARGTILQRIRPHLAFLARRRFPQTS